MRRSRGARTFGVRRFLMRRPREHSRRRCRGTSTSSLSTRIEAEMLGSAPVVRWRMLKRRRSP